MNNLVLVIPSSCANCGGDTMWKLWFRKVHHIV